MPNTNGLPRCWTTTQLGVAQAVCAVRSIIARDGREHAWLVAETALAHGAVAVVLEGSALLLERLHASLVAFGDLVKLGA
eukprot:3712889-Prymnesium_polylepis.1